MNTSRFRFPAAIRGLGTALLLALTTVIANAANFGADNFADAPTIGQYVSTEFLTETTNFTRELGEPFHSAVNLGRSAWWKFIAPTTGPCTVETLPTGHFVDTAIAVYTGTALNNLTLIAQGEDIESSPNARVTFFATAGSVYRIAVESFGFPSEVLLRLRQSTHGARNFIGEWNQLTDDTINSANGLLVLNVSATGLATGKLHVGSKRYSFKTQVTTDSHVIVTFPPAAKSNALPITLSADLASASVPIPGINFSVTNGTFINGTGTLALVSSPQVAAPLAGKYTTGLTFNSITGSGILLWNVSPKGRVTVSGWSGDGQPLAFGSQLANGDRLPVFQSFSNGNGFLNGRVNISSGTITIITDRLKYRRAAATGTFYPNGFYCGVAGTGVRQTPTPPGTRALGFLNGTMGGGKLTTTDAPGELSSLTESLNFSTLNRFAFVSAARKPTLKLNVSTGVVTGSFQQPAGFVRKLRGVLYNESGTARLRGFVTGTTRTAAFSVTP